MFLPHVRHVLASIGGSRRSGPFAAADMMEDAYLMAEVFEKVVAYRPTKTIWFWSTAAMMVLTIILGFTWGGWVTPGSAAAKAKDAANDATVELAASICAYRFLHANDAGAQLAALKKESSYNRSSVIEKGGWVTFAGAKEPIDDAAGLCADRLMKAEVQAQATPAAAATTAVATPS